MRGGGLSDLHTRAPSGLANLSSAQLPHWPYASAAKGAHVFAWRPAHWYTWMWEVGGADATQQQQQQQQQQQRRLGQQVGTETAADDRLLFVSGGNHGGEGAVRNLLLKFLELFALYFTPGTFRDSAFKICLELFALLLCSAPYILMLLMISHTNICL
jgi:hypothetical protein